MKELKYIGLGLALFLACSCAHQSDKAASEINVQLKLLQKQYAPDSRTAIFDVHLKTTGKETILKGKTDQPEAKKALFSFLDQQEVPYKDSIILLPESSLGNLTCGLINISVANLRVDPEHDAELSTQALLGTPVKVLESKHGWYLIQTPDKYISWTDNSAVELLTPDQLDSIKSRPKIIFTQNYGFSYSKPDANAIPVTDLVTGCMLNYVAREGGFYKVSYPDGRVGYVAEQAADNFEDWSQRNPADSASLVNTAEHLMGLPYLWGGTSSKGVDCSGFTKTVYLVNGFVLPRDASQQGAVGIVVDSLRHFENLAPGDLLFFGHKATPNSGERIVHVGMWIGNMKFIHSSGYVHISSMDSTQPDFDQYNYGRYIRAKRILDDKSNFESMALAKLYNNFPAKK